MAETVQDMNDALRNLYEAHTSHFDRFNNEEEDTSNPFLIQAPSDYLEKKTRIMVFGQETNTWYSNLKNNEISKLMEVHGIFEYEGLLARPFARILTDLKNEIPNSSLIWNNVLKVGRYKESGMPSYEMIKYVHGNFNVLKKEIEILKPDFLLFFSSYKYDDFIINQLGNFDVTAVDGFSENELATFTFEDNLRIKRAMRTYHPGYLNRAGLWSRVFEELKRQVLAN